VVLSSPRRVPVLSHPAPAYKKVAELIQAEAAAMVEDDTQRSASGTSMEAETRL